MISFSKAQVITRKTLTYRLYTIVIGRLKKKKKLKRERLIRGEINIDGQSICSFPESWHLDRIEGVVKRRERLAADLEVSNVIKRAWFLPSTYRTNGGATREEGIRKSREVCTIFGTSLAAEGLHRVNLKEPILRERRTPFLFLVTDFEWHCSRLRARERERESFRGTSHLMS